MRSTSDLSVIEWRVYFQSPSERVFSYLTTDEGRARFWARTTTLSETEVTFCFPNGQVTTVTYLSVDRDKRLEMRYFGALVTFVLDSDGAGGCDLTLTARDTPAEGRLEALAGWVSVLLALKAAVDHDIDIRNGDPNRTWDQGYVDQ